ncbi:MAG: UvrB/UvrC motif-containing protein, partial [Planctomycetota bacterium]|nr:UvrB/UvrC motif-containing protein [Planctomycetota bacterium]
LFLRQYAEEEEDRYAIEQYRPYILMMNTQARARLASTEGRQYDALGIAKEGRRKILKFIDENVGLFGISEDCLELRILESLEQEILLGLPEDSVENLRNELSKAVAAQEFEKAASLRDRIRSIEGNG